MQRRKSYRLHRKPRVGILGLFGQARHRQGGRGGQGFAAQCGCFDRVGPLGRDQHVQICRRVRQCGAPVIAASSSACGLGLGLDAPGLGNRAEHLANRKQPLWF